MSTLIRLRNLVCLLCFVLAQAAFAQTAPIPALQEQMARRELERQDVDQDELQKRLLEKGIDIENMSPQDLLYSRPEIEATIAEIKSDKTTEEQLQQEANPPSQKRNTNLDKITESIDSGASVEEAQAEAEIQANLETLKDKTPLVYGHQLFDGKTLEVYRASEKARAPSNYILDSGDELAVSIFGASQIDLILEIGSDGFIKPTGVPRIYLRGRTLEDARKLVRARLSNYYVFQEGQFNMSIDAARTVNISIYGEVEQSGTYTLSALNGPLNALVAAGGPTDQGSIRNIELIRDGQATNIDIYEFLQNPGKTSASTLKDKDIINVPLAMNLVEIRGGVKRPMLYELTEVEKLSQLLKLAGGSTPKAALDATRVTRYENGALSVIDVNPRQYSSFNLSDGDVIEIPTVEEPIENYVSIEGEVLISGRFGYRENLTLSSLLDRAKLKPTARRDVAFIQRSNDNGTTKLQRVNIQESSSDQNTILIKGDKVTVLASKRFISDAEFTVRGAIRDSSLTLPYPKDGKLTLEEAILLSGGLLENALDEALVISNPIENKGERKYTRVKLTDASGYHIEPFDEVIVYTQERFDDEQNVSISGAVRNPVETRWDSTLSINDLIYLAGGIRFDAARDRVEVYRLNLDGNKTLTLVETLALYDNGQTIDQFELKPFDEVHVRSAADFSPIESVTIEGEVRYPGDYGRLKGKNRVSDLIKRAGGLSDDAFAAGATLKRNDGKVGYVVLGLDDILANPASPGNMVLRPGDIISIPKPIDIVTIYTENTYSTNYGADSLSQGGKIEVAYQGERKANWYINKYAGGFTDNAKKKATTVARADGAIKETKSFLGIKLYPTVTTGSKIYTPTKPTKKEKAARERTSWSEIAQVVVAAMTTVATLVIISR